MAVRAPGDYDPNTGWPPDDSTGVNWQNDVNLPGQFKGGGAGFGWGDTDLPGNFGPGGFQGSPRLTAPAAGPPPGISLSNGGGGPPAAGGPTVVPPANSTIPSGKQVGAWTNPFTDAHINPATGQPEMLTGPGGIAEKTAGGFNPLSLLGGGNPYWRGAIAAGGVLTPTPAETGEFTPAEPNFVRPDAPLPLHMPHRPVTPTPGATSMPARPVTPTPITAYPTPTPPPRPRAAGPAAVKQQPNLGHYGAFVPITRPNMNPGTGGGMLGGGTAGGRGGGGPPQMTALDLSRLFSRQQ